MNFIQLALSAETAILMGSDCNSYNTAITYTVKWWWNTIFTVMRELCMVA